MPHTPERSGTTPHNAKPVRPENTSTLAPGSHGKKLNFDRLDENCEPNYVPKITDAPIKALKEETQVERLARQANLQQVAKNLFGR